MVRRARNLRLRGSVPVFLVSIRKDQGFGPGKSFLRWREGENMRADAYVHVLLSFFHYYKEIQGIPD
jgi:hypothetical protein